jgi:hypothetical protein
VHKYHFSLKSGQYARLLHVQRSINVWVSCFGPDGKLTFGADSYKIGDTEIAELIGDTSDDYRFRVPTTVLPSGAAAQEGAHIGKRIGFRVRRHGLLHHRLQPAPERSSSASSPMP